MINKIIQTLLIMLALSFVVLIAISPVIVMHILLGGIGVIIYLILCLFISIYSHIKNNTDNQTKLKEGETKSNTKHNNGVKKCPHPSPRTIKENANKREIKNIFVKYFVNTK